MGRKPATTEDKVLDAIQRWIVQHGEPPTVEELRRTLRVGSSRTILRYLRNLETHGAIRRWHGARGIHPLRVPEVGIDTVPIPIVGEAPAGPLMTAEENREGWVRLPRTFVRPEAKQYFLLRVRGDSMNLATVAGERIDHGDLVLVRQQSTATTGDIVVALIDGEVTIKRFTEGPGYYILKPVSSNPAHQPIVLDRDFSVQGIVVRILKKGSELLGLVEN